MREPDPKKPVLVGVALGLKVSQVLFNGRLWYTSSVDRARSFGRQLAM